METDEKKSTTIERRSLEGCLDRNGTSKEKTESRNGTTLYGDTFMVGVFGSKVDGTRMEVRKFSRFGPKTETEHQEVARMVVDGVVGRLKVN